MVAFFRNQTANFLTCLNLFAGWMCLIRFSETGLESLPEIKIWLIVAGIADFLDGFVARLLKSQSPLGKDLDSLADATTFGIVPSVVAYGYFSEVSIEGLEFLKYIAAMVAIFSVIRLAIFNNDTRQVQGFIGVPTPANAFFLVFTTGMFLIPGFQVGPWFYLLLIIGSSLLLIAPIPLLALKFKTFDWKSNWPRYALIALSLGCVGFFGDLAVPLIFFSYILLSLVQNSKTTHEI
jgi:CDP-diacylglycerol---serine O-phosphatidyltransferase